MYAWDWITRSFKCTVISFMWSCTYNATNQLALSLLIFNCVKVTALLQRNNITFNVVLFLLIFVQWQARKWSNICSLSCLLCVLLFKVCFLFTLILFSKWELNGGKKNIFLSLLFFCLILVLSIPLLGIKTDLET